MRIHTDTLTHDDLTNAVTNLDGVDVQIVQRGSRKRGHAFDVSLSAEPRPGRRNRNTGHNGSSAEAAATWDEWGWFLARLFDRDPNATSDYYDGAEHFHWSTGDRFAAGIAPEPHDQHRWTFTGDVATKTHHVHECACGAIRRILAHQLTWTDSIAQASERSERVSNGITPSEARSDFTAMSA